MQRRKILTLFLTTTIISCLAVNIGLATDDEEHPEIASSPSIAADTGYILITQNYTTYNCSVHYPNGTVYYTSDAFHLHIAVNYAISLASLVNVTTIRMSGFISYEHTISITVADLRFEFDELGIVTIEDAFHVVGCYGIEIDGNYLAGSGGTLIYVEACSQCEISVNNMYADSGPSAVYLYAFNNGICANVFNFIKVIGGTRQIRLETDGSWIGSNTFNVGYMQCYEIGVPTYCISSEVTYGGLNNFNCGVIQSVANNTAIYTKNPAGDFYFQIQIFDVGETSLAVNNSGGKMYCSQTMWSLFYVRNTGQIYYSAHFDPDSGSCFTFLDDGGLSTEMPDYIYTLPNWALIDVLIAACILGVICLVVWSLRSKINTIWKKISRMKRPRVKIHK